MLGDERHSPSLPVDFSSRVAPSSSLALSENLHKKLKNSYSFPLNEPVIHSFDLGNERPLALNATVEKDIQACIMVDSGASTSFIDEKFVKKNHFSLRLKVCPETVHVVDGRQSASGLITHELDLLLTIRNHSEILTFQVTKIARYDIILGKSWLSTHDPEIKWSKNKILFSSAYCRSNCLDSTYPYNATQFSPNSLGAPSNPTRLSRSSSCSSRLSSNPSQWASCHSRSSSRSSSQSSSCSTLSHPLRKTINIDFHGDSEEDNKSEVESYESFLISIHDNYGDKLASEPNEAEDKNELRKQIPPQFHEFLSIFSTSEANKLPPRRYIDHEIPVDSQKKLPLGPLYSMSNAELEELREYLRENLKNGFIEPSTSSFASPVLFVKKPAGGLRLCVDYRALNAVTKKNVYPLPRIDDSLRQLLKAKKFTRLDLRGAYNQIRIKQGDEYKTAFRTRYGLYQYNVMPFGLTNAPATCQQFMNDVLREFLDIFVVVYLDDILIYSENPGEHDDHVRKVLSKLQEYNLFCKPEKCEFNVDTTTFLGFIISPQGLSMDPSKIQTITGWNPPTTVKGVQSFLGFANFYRRFIQDYSKLAEPLFNLTRKNTRFIWSQSCDRSFEALKKAFTSEPILKHFDPKLDTILETDASDRVISAVLSQYHTNSDGIKRLHPVAYFSRKMNSAEVNYTVGDKELLAIVEGLKEYRQYVCNLAAPIKIITDHQNLTVFATKRILNRRQARWALELAEHDFLLEFRPGIKNSRADALTRRLEDFDGEGKVEVCNDLIIPPQKIINCKPSEKIDEISLINSISKRYLEISALKLDSTFIKKFRKNLASDTFAQGIILALESGSSRHPHVDLGSCVVDSDGLLIISELIYVPESLRTTIISTSHDHPAAGHPGRAKTLELVSRNFWWPKIRATIDRFIRNCDTCSRIKPVRHAPYGYLKPLEIPQKRWESISLDFITGLPKSNGFDAILVVVDRLTKMAHFIPTTTSVNTIELVKLLRDNIFRLHGLPESIICDRDPVFTSNLAREFASILSIKPHFSSAFHPQTDGQTERVNAILEQYLRAYCNYQQDNWQELLSLAEFSFNNSWSSVTRVTPFFANYGFNPRYQILARSENRYESVELTEFRQNLEKLEDFIKSEIRYAQEIAAENTNSSRRNPPIFKEGGQVWLLRKNISTKRPSNKLDYKRLGPFKIIKKISSHAYKLDLPHTMRIHPVFHVSLLEPVVSDPLPGQKNPPPPPIMVDGEMEFVVEEILDSKPRGTKPFLVKWLGESIPTWEPYEFVKDLEALERFYIKYPDKNHHGS